MVPASFKIRIFSGLIKQQLKNVMIQFPRLTMLNDQYVLHPLFKNFYEGRRMYKIFLDLNIRYKKLLLIKFPFFGIITLGEKKFCIIDNV